MENKVNITVDLGANKGIDDTFSIAVRELGKWIGANGHTLIYGGSKTGLMGELAESVLMEGGRVTGVEPQFFVEAEVQYDEMTERKTKMIELGDAFIAFPGGTGTLEEITEVMSKLSLNQLSAPCIFYNLNGYYDSIKEFLSHMIAMGLSTNERQKDIYFASDLTEVISILSHF